MEITTDEARMIEAHRAACALKEAGVPSTSAIVAMKLWMKHVLESLRLEVSASTLVNADIVCTLIDRRLKALDNVDGKPG